MTETFNADMLRLARELRGLTQTQLAARTGCKQAFVSRVESGHKAVTIERAEALAAALQVPVPFFFRRGQYSGLGVSAVFFRKRQSALVQHITRLQAETSLRRLILQHVLEAVEIRTTERSFRFYDIDDHDGNSEQIAQLVRASWNLPAGPVANLVAVIEHAGGVVFRFPFGTRDIDAMSQWLPDCPPMFFVNAEAPAERVRFSLGHELGHVLMHRSASEEMEFEADRFASEFLMPAKDVAHDLVDMDLRRAAALKPYWRVSMAALIRRAHQLGKIEQHVYRSLFLYMSKLGYRKREPTAIEGEEPRLFAHLLRSYCEEVGAQVGDLPRLLSMSEEDYSQRFGAKPLGLRLAG